MKKNIIPALLLSGLTFFACSCKEEIVPDFTFSPEQPKAGQSITFTNTTNRGDSWDWNFGNGSTATSKSPSYAFSKPGSYNVTLRVNGNGRYTKTQIVQVYDTIPTIERDTIVYYNQAVTYSVAVYNPNSETVSYKWKFSENATSDSIDANGNAVSSTVVVKFRERNVQETVTLELTVGTTVYPLSNSVYVNDVVYPSLIYAGRDGKLYRQRLIETGVESPIDLNVPVGERPFNLIVNSNELFIFNAGKENQTNGDGFIKVYNLDTKTSATVIDNSNASSESGFYNGFVSGNTVYWTDYSDYLFKIPKNERNKQFDLSYKVAGYADLGYALSAEQISGGVALYNGTYFWAKGGTVNKGIYRFKENNISETQSGQVLDDVAIRSFVIDGSNQRIYYSVTAPAGKVGLWTSRIDGTGQKLIDNSPVGDAQLYISGLAIDYVNNRLYWGYTSPEHEGAAAPGSISWTAYYEANPTHRTGIKYCTLFSSYTQTAEINYIVKDIPTYGIACDNTKRLGE